MAFAENRVCWHGTFAQGVNRKQQKSLASACAAGGVLRGPIGAIRC